LSSGFGQDLLEHEFRLRTRDQHRRTDGKRQRPEFSLAEDIGQRLALPPAGEQFQKEEPGRLRDLFFGRKKEPGPGLAQTVPEQQQDIAVPLRRYRPGEFAWACRISSATRISWGQRLPRQEGRRHQIGRPSLLDVLEFLRLVMGDQRIDDILELAADDGIELIEGEVDAVIGHPPCGKL
jgi:hypothetical protein